MTVHSDVWLNCPTLPIMLHSYTCATTPTCTCLCIQVAPEEHAHVVTNCMFSVFIQRHMYVHTCKTSRTLHHGKPSK